jgi:hypothetical protein
VRTRRADHPEDEEELIALSRREHLPSIADR